MKDISVDMTDAIPRPLIAYVRVTGGWRVRIFCYLVRVAAWVLKSRAEFRFGDMPCDRKRLADAQAFRMSQPD